MDWKRVWERRIYKIRSRTSRWRLNRVKLLSRLAFLVFASLLFLILVSGALFAWLAKDLPQPNKVVRKEGFATKIYDRNEELLYDVYSDQRRTPIILDQVPLHLRNATIAIEDKNFYKHKGFDPKGIFRALYNIIVYQNLQGGSTLTQQLVKNALLTSQRTIPRKIKEFILAVQIESKYSKDEILQMYLNESPYGGTAWGVESASEIYFSKKATDLNLVESAILAGLPQKPSVYSPFSDTPKAFIGRTQQVLRRMHDDGYITKEQEEEARDQLNKVEFATSSANFKAPHFVMYIKKKLEDRFGQQLVEQGGLRVYTTLDFKLQEEAQKTVTEEIAKYESIHITNGAAVAIDPNTGEILAMVGSKNYDDPNYDGKVNVALSLRQPGSAIKPVTYVTAFKKGYTPSSMIMDTQTTFPVVSQPDYNPVNYDGKFHGPLQLRYTLGNSINIPAVKLLARIGLKEMLTTAYEMGINSLEPSKENLQRLGLSVTLGGGEVRLLDISSAYGAFANGGLKVEPVSILKVTDKDGKVLDEYKLVERKRVLSAQQAYLISQILSDNSSRLITFGERSALNIVGRTIAVKTGTTNDKRDNWTIGWTPQIVVGVWVGNNDNSSMKQVASGVSGAAPIWRRIIQAALADKPNISFVAPEGIVSAEVDAVSGYRSHDSFPSRLEYFIPGTEPSSEDPIHTKLKLCRGQDRLATPAQIARGDYEEKEYFVFREDDPVSLDGINRWQEGINQWLVSQTDSRYHPPTELCGSDQEIAVIIKEPNHQQQINSNEIMVKIDVVSNNKVEKVEFYIDGNFKDEAKNRPYEKVFNISDGPHTIKIKVRDDKGNQSEAEVKVGIKVPWDWQPTPTPTLSPTPTPSSFPPPTITP